MAAYPTSVPVKTKVTGLNRTMEDIMEDGSIRAVDLAQQELYQITILHPYAVDADITTIENFYTTNRNVSNRITASDGEQYDFFFSHPPENELIEGLYFNIRLVVRGTRV